MKPITNSQAALEFFANVLLLKGIIDVRINDKILSASTMEDLDNIIDEMALEVSGDGE